MQLRKRHLYHIRALGFFRANSMARELFSNHLQVGCFYGVGLALHFPFVDYARSRFC